MFRLPRKRFAAPALGLSAVGLAAGLFFNAGSQVIPKQPTVGFDGKAIHLGVVPFGYRDPATGQWVTLEVTPQVTMRNGKQVLTITPDAIHAAQVAQGLSGK